MGGFTDILYGGLSENFNKASLVSNAPSTTANSIVVAHVLDVITDSNSDHPIGSIRFRDITINRGIAEESVQTYALPLDRANYRLPLPGEQVIVITAIGHTIDKVYRTQYFYLGVVTSEATITQDIMPFLSNDPQHLSKTGTKVTQKEADQLASRFSNKVKHNLKVTEELTSIQKVVEGDTILEGRFGGNIKFTSTIASEKVSSFETNGSSDGDPLVIIKNTRRLPTKKPTFVEDNVNTDDVSFYLTTTQTVPVKLACSTKMYTWNQNVTAGNISVGDDPSTNYQKIFDTTAGVNKGYITP